MPRFSRLLRRRLASFMVLVMLALQMATAAYACPGLSGGAQSGQSPAMAAMPGCAQSAQMPGGMMDPDQPGLCQAHCNADSTASSDQGSNTLQLPAPTPVLFAWALFFAIPLRGPHLSRAPKTERATPPPLSILHCCYRV